MIAPLLFSAAASLGASFSFQQTSASARQVCSSKTMKFKKSSQFTDFSPVRYFLMPRSDVQDAICLTSSYIESAEGPSLPKSMTEKPRRVHFASAGRAVAITVAAAAATAKSIRYDIKFPLKNSRDSRRSNHAASYNGGDVSCLAACSCISGKCCGRAPPDGARPHKSIISANPIFACLTSVHVRRVGTESALRRIEEEAAIEGTGDRLL